MCGPCPAAYATTVISGTLPSTKCSSTSSLALYSTSSFESRVNEEIPSFDLIKRAAIHLCLRYDNTSEPIVTLSDPRVWLQQLGPSDIQPLQLLSLTSPSNFEVCGSLLVTSLGHLDCESLHCLLCITALASSALNETVAATSACHRVKVSGSSPEDSNENIDQQIVRTLVVVSGAMLLCLGWAACRLRQNVSPDSENEIPGPFQPLRD